MTLLQPRVSKEKPLNRGILVVCEDTKSNFYYLDEKIKSCNLYAAKILYDIKDSNAAGGPQPDKIANYAITETEKRNLSYYNNDPDNDRFFYKEVYCIVDVDDNILNRSLPKAISGIRDANAQTPQVNYQLIISNECFEIWYILHFIDIKMPLYRGTKPQHSQGLISSNNQNLISSVLYNHAGTSAKTSDQYFTIMQTQGDEAAAIRRAKALKAASPTQNPDSNPSTEVYILIERLNALSTAKTPSIIPPPATPKASPPSAA